MRYLIEPRDGLVLKKMNKNLRNKYCRKRLDSPKGSTTDAIKLQALQKSPQHSCTQKMIMIIVN